MDWCGGQKALDFCLEALLKEYICNCDQGLKMWSQEKSILKLHRNGHNQHSNQTISYLYPILD